MAAALVHVIGSISQVHRPPVAGERVGALQLRAGPHGGSTSCTPHSNPYGPPASDARPETATTTKRAAHSTCTEQQAGLINYDWDECLRCSNPRQTSKNRRGIPQVWTQQAPPPGPGPQKKKKKTDSGLKILFAQSCLIGVHQESSEEPHQMKSSTFQKPAADPAATTRPRWSAVGTRAGFLSYCETCCCGALHDPALC